jgi:RecB family endonuclease NucS
MRIVVAVCEITYEGRGSTHLPKATRAIFIKADGAVSIHQDSGTKPLNYMGAGNTMNETRRGRQRTWTFTMKKESILIKISKIISDQTVLLEGADPGLSRERTEHHLQAWIANNPECLGDGFTFVAREYPTGAGPVDLLMRDAEGRYVAVEVKRVAMLGAVDQTSRYVEALNSSGELGTVLGMVAALDIRPRTVALAEKRGFTCVVVPAPPA